MRANARDKWEILDLKRAYQDPTDLEKKVEEFQKWRELKIAGKLPMYEVK